MTHPNPITRCLDGTLTPNVTAAEYALRWSAPISEEEAREELAMQIREIEHADRVRAWSRAR